jgi:hypothetical protein
MEDQQMTDRANYEGLKNQGRGPSQGRPSSVGQNSILPEHAGPDTKGLDPEKDYKGGGAGNGPNTGMGITGKPGGPVNIKVKK